MDYEKFSLLGFAQIGIADGAEQSRHIPILTNLMSNYMNKIELTMITVKGRGKRIL